MSDLFKNHIVGEAAYVIITELVEDIFMLIPSTIFLSSA